MSLQPYSLYSTACLHSRSPSTARYLASLDLLLTASCLLSQGYCMQDVCVSFWPEGAFTNDMIAKVTDICSTDPSDPSHCATPSDIKVDRAKVQVMYDIPVPGSENAALQADKYIKGTYWHLTKCWANVCETILFCPIPSSLHHFRSPHFISAPYTH